MHHKCRERLTNYAAIGFDMDHTFLQYKLRNFVELMYNSTASFLVETKGYPKEMYPTDKTMAENLYKYFFRSVFDHKNGNLLKIGWENLILRGYNGMHRLSRDEIEQEYGPFPKIQDYHMLSHHHEDFTNLHEFYTSSSVPILAQIVNLKRTGYFSILDNKSYYDIMDDVKDSWEHNESGGHSEFKQGKHSGYLLPTLLTKPNDYVNKTPVQLLKKLEEIRQKGVLVFISSNSSFQVAEALMQEAVGKDWLDRFDFVMYDNNKPHFFRKQNQYPPFETLNGEKITDFESFIGTHKKGNEKVLLNGHAQHLNSYFAKSYGPYYKVLFFGDTIVTDAFYSYNRQINENWDIALIIEELHELREFRHNEYFDYRDVWGSALKEKNPYTDEDCTIIYHFARHLAKAHFQKVNTIECLDFLTL